MQDEASSPLTLSPVGDQLMRADQVARTLGISVRQVWKLTSRGILPTPVRIGSSTRWRASDVRRVITGETRIPQRRPQPDGASEG